MSQKEFAGIFPYLVTPIDQSGNLKEDVLRDLVNHLISKGVHGLTPLGSTGRRLPSLGTKKKGDRGGSRDYCRSRPRYCRC